MSRSKYGNFIFLLILGLKAWPSKWFTALKGFFKDPAIDLPAFKLTGKNTIKPGPPVADIPFIFFKSKLLSFIAFLIINSIFSTWALAAI